MILLIFDENDWFQTCCWRCSGITNITADIVCFGKVIGGGLPVGAFAAREEIIIISSVRSHQAGTLSGNPLAMAAGLAHVTSFR
jgi:glutamate-1-semialdehyde 2,1-aminomutase